MKISSMICTSIAVGAALSSRAEPDSRPNIIVILSDDMGYSDIGCFGSEIQTPNLDRLARNGIRMSQFYNAARCCPSRASLLTGLYPHSTGVGGMTGWTYPEQANPDGYQKAISKHCLTIAQVLKPAGYRTYALGKWHVSDKMTGNGTDRGNWPLQRGFDSFYGTLAGAGSYYDPAWLMRDNKLISAYADPEYKPDGVYYYTDAITDHAVKEIRRHAEQHKDRPFFMYVAYTAAHWPLQAPEETVRKYQGVYDQGYDAVRTQRFARLKEKGLIPPDWKPSETVGDWAAVSNKQWEARCMEVYAAAVDRMDQGIGKIAAELERTGQTENTLIMYLQDNGACAEDFGHTERAEWNVPDIDPIPAAEIQRKVVPPMHTRDGKIVQNGPDTMPGPDGTFVSYGENWANVCNTPFRRYKQYTHEGGISTPFIACWPAKIKSPGRIADDPAHLIDIMATCVDFSGAQYPDESSGESILPLPGVSLRPVFDGDHLPVRTFYWEHQGCRAIRGEDWKLVSDGPEDVWELYNMENDRTEMQNLARQYPERVAHLSAAWTDFAKKNGVLPWPWGLSDGKFILRQGDRFGELMTPDLSGKSFEIIAEGDFSAQSQGVIVSQGDSSGGYALFCDAGMLCFCVRFSRDDQVQVEMPLPDGVQQIKAVWKEKTGLSLLIDGKTAQSAAAGRSLLMNNPNSGISCGKGSPVLMEMHSLPAQFNEHIDRVLIHAL